LGFVHEKKSFITGRLLPSYHSFGLAIQSIGLHCDVLAFQELRPRA
jgi:hypothetical protein